MNTKYRYTSLAAAVLLALGGAAQAQEYSLDQLVVEQKSIVSGIGYVTDDNHYFGQYHGPVDTTDKGFVPLFNLDYARRDAATGSWWNASAATGGVGRYNPDGYWGRSGIGLEYYRQGDWGASLEYDENTRTNPFTFNTGLTGIGSNNLTSNGTALRDLKLETERENVRLGLVKHLPENFDLRFKFRNEDKEGARQWGFYVGGGNIIFLAEPIDYQTREYEAIVGYTGEALQLSGGYYGTSFDNADEVVNFDGRTASLPLDNESGQFFVTGGYQFTPTTRATFHASRGEQTQDENFFEPSAGTGRTSLDGKVETTLLTAGLTSRPFKNLSLSARARYDDRDDQTPVDNYRASRKNVVWSRTFTTLDLDAAYRLPMGLKLKGGYEYDKRERDFQSDDNLDGVPDGDYRSVTFRHETEEDTFRIGLSRMMSPSLNGKIVYLRKERDGSTPLDDSNLGQDDRVVPRHWANRDRDQLKLVADWLVSEALSMQFRYEYTDDDYSTPNRDLGVTSGGSQMVTADATYAINYDWKLTGWASVIRSEIDQSGLDSGTDEWDAKLKNDGLALGLGLRGTPTGDLKVGVDLKYTYDVNEHQTVDRTGDVLDPLPDIKYKLWSAHFFGDYAVDENATVRLDLIYEKRTANDWTYRLLNGDPWEYNGDGSTVLQDPEEDVVFAGVSFNYRWR